MEIGAQLYTVREFCKNLDDFSETLKKVADIGYTNVQVSGSCDFEAEWLKNELQKNGLKCVITHAKDQRLIEEPEALAKAHEVFGCHYVGLGGVLFDEPNGITYPEFIKNYKNTAKILKENGKYFMFHNHATEFKRLDGKRIIESLAEDFSPEEMGFTLDTYWVQVGGGDPAQWIERLSGRVPCIHLKDYAYGPQMAVVGEGNLNFDRIFAAAQKAGTKYMLVEQDNCNGENPFDCLKRSYNNLKAFGF